MAMKRHPESDKPVTCCAECPSRLHLCAPDGIYERGLVCGNRYVVLAIPTNAHKAIDPGCRLPDWVEPEPKPDWVEPEPKPDWVEPEPKPDYLCVPAGPWSARFCDADAMEFTDVHGRDVCTVRCRGRCIEVVGSHILACVNAAERADKSAELWKQIDGAIRRLRGEQPNEQRIEQMRGEAEPGYTEYGPCPDCGASTCSLDAAAAWIKDGDERICWTCGEKRLADLRKRIDAAIHELTEGDKRHGGVYWIRNDAAVRILRGKEPTDG